MSRLPLSHRVKTGLTGQPCCVIYMSLISFLPSATCCALLTYLIVHDFPQTIGGRRHFFNEPRCSSTIVSSNSENSKDSDILNHLDNSENLDNTDTSSVKFWGHNLRLIFCKGEYPRWTGWAWRCQSAIDLVHIWMNRPCILTRAGAHAPFIDQSLVLATLLSLTI